MKILCLIPALLFFNLFTHAQTKFDSALHKKLVMMRTEDQKWRIEIYKLSQHQNSDYDEVTIEKNMARADSINIIDVKAIFRKYGYPSYALVGKVGSSCFWTIVQHCDDDVNFQQNVLVAMDKEVRRHNASGENYAYLKDRVLVNQGHKQLYGTQLKLNPKTHLYEALPMENPANVDTRRKAVGLSPLSDYLKQNNPSN